VPAAIQRCQRGLIVGVLCLLVGGCGPEAGYETLPEGAGVVVPEVVGLGYVEACIALERAGLKVGVVRMQQSGSARPGVVLDQRPPNGLRIRDATRVHLDVEECVVLTPAVTGLGLDQANRELRRLGLAPQVVYVQGRSAPPGTVIEQSPVPNRELPMASLVMLKVVYRPVLMPDVLGLHPPQAAATLDRSGLAYEFRLREGGPGRPGTVVQQLPAAGLWVNAGASVVVVIKAGNATVVTPDIVGKTVRTAGRTLEQAGLRWRIVASVKAPDGPGAVLRQRPSPGVTLKAGDEVQLFVSVPSSPDDAPKNESFPMPAFD